MELLATVQVPEHDSTVIAAAGQLRPIGTHLQRLHRPSMSFSHLHALPMPQVPPAQHTIAAAVDQHCSARFPCECIYHSARFAQCVEAHSTLRLPDEEFSNALS